MAQSCLHLIKFNHKITSEGEESSSFFVLCFEIMFAISVPFLPSIEEIKVIMFGCGCCSGGGEKPASGGYSLLAGLCFSCDCLLPQKSEERLGFWAERRFDKRLKKELSIIIYIHFF